MDRDSIFRLLLRSVNDFGGHAYSPDDIDLSRSIFDFGVDSLNVMQILGELEDAGIQIDLSGLTEEHVGSINALLDYLEASDSFRQLPDDTAQPLPRPGF